MSEKFQVGQWVNVHGCINKIIEIMPHSARLDDGFSIEIEHVEPFRWKLKHTYKTTLDGVTATIDKETTAERVVAWLSNGAYLSFSGVDGELMPIVPNPLCPTHLLPYLSDATPPVAEADTFSEFEVDGERGALELLCAELTKRREQCEIEASAWESKANVWRQAEQLVRQASERAGKCQD